MNQILKAVYDAGLMNFTLKKITPDAIQDDFFLLIFLSNDIDTNFISVFIPEIYNEGSQFFEKDKDGKTMSKPC